MQKATFEAVTLAPSRIGVPDAELAAEYPFARRRATWYRCRLVRERKYLDLSLIPQCETI